MQEKLISLRKKYNTSQKELSDLLGITEKQFDHKEQGIKSFNSEEMYRISIYFNLLVGDIFLPRYHQNGELMKG